MDAKKIYFLSDIHLGNRYLSDSTAIEKKLVFLLDSIKDDALSIYFLGDIFDYWYEYKYVAPKGHVRFLGKIAELCDKGIDIHFFIGNHDIWMFDYLPAETGVKIHKKPLVTELLGKTFFLGHGDEIGARPFSYRFIQVFFRNRICQILYSAIHPRWTFAFARKWSLSSRKNAPENEKLKKLQERNKQAIKEFCESYLQTHSEINFFIFGHLHILSETQLSETAQLIFTGDWLNHFSFAVWDGKQLELKQD